MRQIMLAIMVLVSMLSLLVGAGGQQQQAAQRARAVRSAWYGHDEKVRDEERDHNDVLEKKEVDDEAEVNKKENEENEEEEEITLERLFPEKSFFGPSARSMAFSTDGKYAAYLYRPYLERRHGSDLWIYDVETGESKRITSVSVMSKFQEATRKVKEDRLKKAKKKHKGKGKGETSKKEGDGITGEWHGILTGPAEFDIPPEGVAFILSLELDNEKNVGGTFRSAVADATVTKGEWDPKKRVVSCTLVDPESGLAGALTGKVSDGDSMEGAIATENPEATFHFTATRKKPTQSGDDDENGKVRKTDDDDDAGNGQGGDADDLDKKKDEEVGDDQKGDEEDEGGHGDADDDNGEDDEDVRLIDEVDEKDADDEKAPRYGGISSFEWAPKKNELLMISGGDIYLYVVEGEGGRAGEITRLTRSTERESGVQYLPDGSGYTVRRSNGVLRVTFGNHLVEQIDPAFPAGEEMTSYKLSPDGQRVSFVTSKGKSFWGAGRTVNIVNYRSRFAQVSAVSRHMSDDPRPTVESAVYLYQINDSMLEDGQLDKVYGYSSNGPRDALTGPEWALDSSRIVFMRYTQSDNIVRILEASYPESKVEDDHEDVDGADKESGEIDGDAKESDEEVEKGTEEDGEGESVDEEKGEGESEDDDAEADDKKPEVIKAGEAKIVYRFSHNGGPNTPGMIHPYYLPDHRRIAMITELSGFRHLHILDPTYEQLDQITHGRYEVYPLRISRDHHYLFATSTKEHPSQLDVYRIDLETGEMTRLDQMDGTYSGAAMSNDGKHVLANFVDYGRLRELVAINVGEENGERTLTDSHPDEARKLTKPIPEFFSYENRHGQTIYGQMFKPDDWTPQDKRPLLIYVYGGPLGTQKMVTRGSYSSDSYFFAYYMAKKHGYVTCTIDPRGASGYGGLFEKSNYEQVGKPQVEDLVDGAKWFIKNQGVDATKVGIHGWSFGGFQTQMCMYTEPDVFAVGMAGAGPTEWENYNSWYSTGTIGPSREGKTDLAKFSLLPLAKNLKGKLLLAHGMEDSNVLYQDTVRVYRELLKAGKETNVELFLDPTGGHGLGGDIKRIGRMRKYEDFLLRTLGEGHGIKKEEDAEEDDGNAEVDTDEVEGASEKAGEAGEAGDESKSVEGDGSGNDGDPAP